MSGSLQMVAIKNNVVVFVIAMLVGLLCATKAGAQDPTVGCENCPQNTTCINEMCYIVVAAPPGIDSSCNEAFCNVEMDGKCIDGQCVVLQNGIGLAPPATSDRTPAATASSPSSAGIILTTWWLAVVLCLVCI